MHLRTREPGKSSLLTAHLGAQCPMCAVKKTIWIFQLPMTKDETHIQRMCDGMMQMRMHETERKQHKGVIHTYETAEIQL